MYDISFMFDRFHCNQESDFAGAEPYLWTLYFHLDISKIFFSHPMETFTPHKTWTTRGMYANGVRAGDDVLIPQSLGRYATALEDAGLDAMFAGFICVLIDQDGTDGDAIKAGHIAFADSAHEALNEVARDLVGPVLDGDEPDITPERIALIREKISADVTNAIRGAQNWRDYFDNQDDLIGFGLKTFNANQIKGAAEVANPINLAINIRRERVIQNQNQETILIDDYDVFGHFIASTPRRRGALNWPEHNGYDKAVEDYTDTRSAIDTLRNKLLKAGGKADPKLVGEMRKLKKEALPLAKQSLMDRFPAEWKGSIRHPYK